MKIPYSVAKVNCCVDNKISMLSAWCHPLEKCYFSHGKMFQLRFLENANNPLYSKRVIHNLIVSCNYTGKVADGNPQRRKILKKIFHNCLLSSSIPLMKELWEIILPWLSKMSRDRLKNNFKKYSRIPMILQ